MRLIDADGLDGILRAPKAVQPEVVDVVAWEPIAEEADAGTPTRLLLGGALAGALAAGLSFGVASWFSSSARVEVARAPDPAPSAAVAMVAPDPVSAVRPDAAAAPAVAATAPASGAPSTAAPAAAVPASAVDAGAVVRADKPEEVAVTASTVPSAAAPAASRSGTLEVPVAATPPPRPPAPTGSPAAAKAALAPAASPVARAATPAASGLTALYSLRFGWDSDVLSTSSRRALVEAAGRCTGTLTLTGHTCDIGDPAYNLDLSQRRARAVASALEDAGVPASRLRVRGEGAASGEGARRDSRRVDVHCEGGT